MKVLTELIVRAADLAEAEGRILRLMVARTALSVAVTVVAGGTVLAGLVLVLGSVYLATADHVGPAGGAAITGGLALAAGGGLAWLGQRMAR